MYAYTNILSPTSHLLNQSKTHPLFAQNRKNHKLFSQPLTLYFTITYYISLWPLCPLWLTFFESNAHLRPIIGRLYIPMLYEIEFNGVRRSIFRIDTEQGRMYGNKTTPRPPWLQTTCRPAAQNKKLSKFRVNF
jgi:hypothetical protein